MAERVVRLFVSEEDLDEAGVGLEDCPELVAVKLTLLLQKRGMLPPHIHLWPKLGPFPPRREH